jgi:hypothetical protein
LAKANGNRLGLLKLGKDNIYLESDNAAKANGNRLVWLKQGQHIK